MIYNIDTYVEAYEMKTEQIAGDGFIPCFHAPGEHWSFAKLDANGKVVEVREKNVFPTTVHSVLIISRPVHCTNSFITNTIPAKKSWKRVKKYVAPLYNYLISKGGDVRISIVDFEKVHVLGTPEELNYFLEHYKG